MVTLPVHCGGAGDITPATARGSVQALRACAQRAWGSPSDKVAQAVDELGVATAGPDEIHGLDALQIAEERIAALDHRRQP